MQAAAKLEPQNAKIRLMLAQFFIDRNMKKRAEGELTRFLEMAPDNREARTLLDGLLR
jgi:predicted Zn-dependent protease